MSSIFEPTGTVLPNAKYLSSRRNVSSTLVSMMTKPSSMFTTATNTSTNNKRDWTLRKLEKFTNNHIINSKNNHNKDNNIIKKKKTGWNHFHPKKDHMDATVSLMIHPSLSPSTTTITTASTVSTSSTVSTAFTTEDDETAVCDSLPPSTTGIEVVLPPVIPEPTSPTSTRDVILLMDDYATLQLVKTDPPSLHLQQQQNAVVELSRTASTLTRDASSSSSSSSSSSPCSSCDDHDDDNDSLSYDDDDDDDDNNDHGNEKSLYNDQLLPSSASLIFEGGPTSSSAPAAAVAVVVKTGRVVVVDESPSDEVTDDDRDDTSDEELLGLAFINDDLDIPVSSFSIECCDD